MLITKSGDKLIVELENGERVFYEIIDDLVNPLKMIKALTKEQVNEYKRLITEKIGSKGNVKRTFPNFFKFDPFKMCNNLNIIRSKNKILKFFRSIY